jgi:hypothetical protein
MVKESPLQVLATLLPKEVPLVPILLEASLKGDYTSNNDIYNA